MFWASCCSSHICVPALSGNRHGLHSKYTKFKASALRLAFLLIQLLMSAYTVPHNVVVGSGGESLRGWRLNRKSPSPRVKRRLLPCGVWKQALRNIIKTFRNTQRHHSLDPNAVRIIQYPGLYVLRHSSCQQIQTVLNTRKVNGSYFSWVEFLPTVTPAHVHRAPSFNLYL